jgi:hypothetical protein
MQNMLIAVLLQDLQAKSLWPLRKSVLLSKTRIISSFIDAFLAFMNLDLYFEWVSGLKSPMKWIWILKTCFIILEVAGAVHLHTS